MQSALRPPGAGSEEAFLRRCIHCGKCVEICKYGALKLNGGFGRGRHTPEMEPEKAPCVLCMKCPPVCPSGALDNGLKDMRQVRMGQAYIIRQLCHNHNGGIMCATCYDRCPLRGHAVMLKDGLSPAITNACAGCGVCQYVCPTRAIIVLPPGRPAPERALPAEPAPAWPDDGDGA